MSLNLYERMKKLYSKLQGNSVVDVKLIPDQIRKIRIPQSLIDISKEEGITYDELVSFILTEFHNRMTKDIRVYTRDIVNIIKTFPGIDENTKKKLLIYILKEMNMEEGK